MNRDATFVDILRRRSSDHPDRDAYIMLSKKGEKEEPITYSDLESRVIGIAAALQGNCKKGDRVLLLCPPGLDYICGFFGCLFAGVIAVPAYPPTRSKNNQNMERLQGMIADAGALAVLSTTEIIQANQSFYDASPQLRSMHWIAIDVITGSTTAPWKMPDIASDDVAFLQYTSGSTGAPKGVMVSHENLMQNSAQIYQRFGHSQESSGVIWLPPYHDMGLIGGILQPLYGGFPTVLMSPAAFIQRPILWLQAISRYRATTSGGPDFAYAQCVRQVTQEQCEALDLSSWRVAFTGAEPIRRETLELFAKKFSSCGFRSEAFYPCYGLAEATLFVTGGSVHEEPKYMSVDNQSLQEHRLVEKVATDPASLTLVGCGALAQAQHRIVIVNPETSAAVDPGTVGEIWVAGPSIARGYWNKEIATNETFRAFLASGEGPFMRTGDFGCTKDGELYITGRIKDLIIVRGKNHYPHDIEATVFNTTPGLLKGAVAVFAVDKAADVNIVVLAELDHSVAADLDLRAARICQAITEQHGLRVDEVVFVKSRSIPKTSSGKIQRFACRQLYLANGLQVIANVVASNLASFSDVGEAQATSTGHSGKPASAENLRRCLISSIAKIRNQREENIDADVEFFNLGLDSLELVQLSGILETEFNRSVDTACFFEHPTINKLAAYLGAPLATTFSDKPAPASNHDDAAIAIVGLSCRFPGANDPHAFWELLAGGKDAISEVPSMRWDVDALYDPTPAKKGKMSTRWGGFIADVEHFDAEFFGISPREAVRMDPQHRLLMELASEAFEDAGITSDQLSGSRTGVFIGISSSDYSMLQGGHDQLDAYCGTGNAHSIAANRISYFFDLHGPSLSIDTACSSSLVALHLACKSLQDGECDTALVGGINLMLRPELHIVFSQARMMSSDGRCKAFDDSANGYVRSEGGGFVVLRRLPDAEKEQNRVLGIVRASAVNQDGRSNGITAPNGRAQESVIRQALEKAGIKPEWVSYVEAHGTGTRLGDPIEYRALENTYGVSSRVTPLLVGSVKSNIGHLEAAAGLAGMIKVVLALNHKVLPAHLHFEKLNTHIASSNHNINVCRHQTEWQDQGRARIAGVSSFGFGGTNCHVLIEEAPIRIPPVAVGSAKQFHFLTLSAPKEALLRKLAQKYASYLDDSAASIADICYTTNIGRNQFDHRLVIRAEDVPTLSERLRLFVDGQINGATESGMAKKSDPGVVFLFTGQGAQYPGMGLDLYNVFPVFRDAINQCDQLLRPLWDVSLTSLLYGDDFELKAQIYDVEYAQISIFAFEYALAQLWLSWGVRPAAVIGHSLGEYSAACLAGVFSLADVLKLLVHRARLMKTAKPDGVMLVVHTDAASIGPILMEYADSISIAADNAPGIIVLAGSRDIINEVIRELTQQRISSQLLPVSSAFHSAYMDPLLDQFERVAGEVTYHPPSVPLISNLSGEYLSQSERMNAQYWRRHMRHTVQFAQGVRTAFNQGHRIFLEIGPDAVLTGMAKRCVDRKEALCLSSISKSRNDHAALLDVLAKLHVAGAKIDWKTFHQPYPRNRVSLPTQVFQKTRYWPASTTTEISLSKPTGSLRSARALQTTDSVLTFSDIEMKKTQTDFDVTTPAATTTSSSKLSELCGLIASLLQLNVEDIDVHAPFLEMGADSLILLDAIHAIDDKYGVHLTINQLFEDTPTITALAAYIETQMVIHAAAEEKNLVADSGLQRSASYPPASVEAISPPASFSNGVASPDNSVVAGIVQQQLNVISQQLALLSQMSPATRPESATAAVELHNKRLLSIKDAPADVMTQGIVSKETTQKEAGVAAASTAWASVRQQEKSGQTFTSWNRPPVAAQENLDATKKEHLDNLLGLHLSRTAKSKDLAQRYRPVLADNRASAGFRLSTKEMLYPLVGQRAQGSRLWDIDGNEYIDFTMGFGANLFGHSPSFITDAIRSQLDMGFQIGPQATLAGVVAEKIALMTRQERVAFCNSGSEAVMTAVRLARTVTKRTKIAIFSGSYHGTFDGILARSRVADGLLYTVPVAPGTPKSFVEQEILVLEYGQDESLAILKAHIHELAAVIVEPVQSRFPNNQPLEFLRQLRALTEAAGTAFIWDEVITGFRAAPGGAQEYFGISADIATYGKIVGGGMPIGVVAGKHRFLDAIDGGMWTYGDNSYPKAEQTFFAGTFSKHPLALSAALAVLERIEEAGPELHHDLNARTASLAERLNRHFMEHEVPLRIEQFSSLFRFAFSGNMDLLFHHLMTKGIFIWEGRNCFLSTAHSDDDVEFFIQAVKESVRELSDSGFFPAADGHRKLQPLASDIKDGASVLDLMPAQVRFANLVQSSDEDSKICHIAFALKMHAEVQLQVLEDAFNDVLGRHEALRAGFELTTSRQHIFSPLKLKLSFVDLMSHEEDARDAQLRAWQIQENQRVFDLTKPPLLRASLVRMKSDEHILHLTVHHLICDGMSLAIVLDEIAQLYAARSQGKAVELAEPLSLSAYMKRLASTEPAKKELAEAYWREQLTPAPTLSLPRLKEAAVSLADCLGARERISLDKRTYLAIREYGKGQKCTPFMTLFAAYCVLLFEKCAQQDLLVGVPVIGRHTRPNERLIGNFVNLLPIRSRPENGMKFADYLLQIKNELLGAYRYADYPCTPLLEGRDAKCRQLSTTFNMEPAVVPSNFADIQVELFSAPVSHIEFDLMMNVTEAESAIHIDLDYRLRTLTPSDAQQWLGRYAEILMLIIEHDSAWTLSTGSEVLSA